MMCLDALTIMPQVCYASPSITSGLIGDICLSSECRNYEEYDLCLVQDIEVLVVLSNALIWIAIRLRNLPIGDACESICPAEFVD